MEALVVFFGLIAGFIDSIAGGGGLITLPVLIWILQSGPEAVATNKIVGTSAALAALIVYARSGHLVIKEGLTFACAVGTGAVLGSFVTPFIPEWAFRWFILILSPIILWVVSQREMWVKERALRTGFARRHLLGWGLLAGFYDGMWGPGGGTFMFLVLFLGARQPMMQALACAKLANVFSAGFSLGTFALRGYVHWALGAGMASAMVVGALVGARIADRQAARVVRPVLVVVTLLLIAKVFFDYYGSR